MIFITMLHYRKTIQSEQGEALVLNFRGERKRVYIFVKYTGAAATDGQISKKNTSDIYHLILFTLATFPYKSVYLITDMFYLRRSIS